MLIKLSAMKTKIKYAYQNLNVFREVHKGMLLLISSFVWMLHILACKMRFKYCFSLSSSFLSFICFIFMLFFRSENRSLIHRLLPRNIYLLIANMRVIYRENVLFFELDLCLEFLWLQHRLLSELWISEDLTSAFYY